MLVNPRVRFSTQAVIVSVEDDGVDMKAEPVLPHMNTNLDQHAHSFSCEAQHCESHSISAISPLWACSQPTGPCRDAVFCWSLVVYHFFISFHMTWLGFLFSLLFLPDWGKRSPRSQHGWWGATEAVLELWNHLSNLITLLSLFLNHMSSRCPTNGYLSVMSLKQEEKWILTVDLYSLIVWLSTGEQHHID